MINIEWIRKDPDKIRDVCIRRGSSVDVDALVGVDAEFRKKSTAIDQLRHERNVLAALRRPDPRMVALKHEIASLKGEVDSLRERRDALWATLPNLLPDDTPDGADDSGNVELEQWGDRPQFDFEPQPHDVLAARLGLIDFERGTKVAGSGFVYWVGDGARLARALYAMALDVLCEAGFTEMLTPVMAREATLFGTGYLPFFGDQVYRIEGENLALIGTSEQTLLGYHADEILETGALPLRYCSFSPCFRTEAGSHGRVSRGAFRQHQFHKVEQIVVCAPDESEARLQECVDNAAGFLQRLELPYRTVRVCVGDLGAPAYKKIDIEAWFAGFGAYRETHSLSDLWDYQCRRLAIRWAKSGKKKVFPHTISATMATDRTLLALLELNQRADGSVVVPEALRPALRGRSVLEPKS